MIIITIIITIIIMIMIMIMRPPIAAGPGGVAWRRCGPSFLSEAYKRGRIKKQRNLICLVLEG